MDKVLFDAREEIDDETEEGEIVDSDDATTTTLKQSEEEITVRPETVFQDNRVDWRSNGNRSDVRWETNHHGQGVSTPAAKRPGVFNNRRRRSTRANKRKRENYDDGGITIDDGGVTYTRRGCVSFDSNDKDNDTKVSRGYQHSFKKLRYGQPEYRDKNQGYTNYFEQDSFAQRVHTFSTKAEQKEIPSLLTIRIPIPPEFQKNNYNNTMKNTSMPSISPNHTAVDDTFDMKPEYENEDDGRLILVIDENRRKEKQNAFEKRGQRQKYINDDTSYDEFDDLADDKEVKCRMKLCCQSMAINI